jgi:transcriptional regulator with XRE-family HTH domain
MKLDYASAIINLRIKLNLSQSALAELLGVSFTSVNRWENDKYSPTKLVKKKIELLCKENDIQMEVRGHE